MHNMLIRVTTGEFQVECVQLWRDGKCYWQLRGTSRADANGVVLPMLLNHGMADNFSACSSNAVCKKVEAYCLRSIFSRLVLVSGRLEDLWKRRRFLGSLLRWLKNTSARKLENASGVHLLCTGVTNEARVLVTFACNSFMNIFWAYNSITRELTFSGLDNI